jgi:class 3 adenylate cyclase
MDGRSVGAHDLVRVRVDLPSGAVTFLFTDIEGSTRLIEELGEEGYVEALAVHRRALRNASAAHGGVEVDTQGGRLPLCLL